MAIKIVRVGKDEAPNTADRLAVHLSGCGLYAWSGAIESNGRAIFGGSVPEFHSANEAETAAIAWAVHHGINEVMIENPDAASGPGSEPSLQLFTVECRPSGEERAYTFFVPAFDPEGAILKATMCAAEAEPYDVANPFRDHAELEIRVGTFDPNDPTITVFGDWSLFRQ